MAANYSLRIDTVEGLSGKSGGASLGRTKTSHYVEILRDGAKVHRTPVKPGLEPQWKDLYEISSDFESSNYTLQLYCHDSYPHNFLPRDRPVGTVDTNLAALLEHGENTNGKSIKLPLTAFEAKSKGNPIGTLLVRLMRQGTASLLQRAQRRSESARLSLEAGPSTIKHHVHYGPLSVAESALGVLITKLELLARLQDTISKIHVYAYMAWKIFTSVLKAVQKQPNTSNKLPNLLQTITDTYSFANDTDFVAAEIKSLEDKVFVILKQTIECAFFIEEYTVHGFRSHPMRNPWNGTNGMIDDFAEAFLRLKASFDGKKSTVEEIFYWAETKEVETLADFNLFQRLNPVEMNAESRPECLAGTRREILNEITEWLAVPDDSGKILWLSGAAGSGKSAISATISKVFRGLRRLGAFIFFDRNDEARSHPEGVIRTLAYSLARHNAHIAIAIAAAIERDPSVVTAPLPAQFKKLLLEPLLSVANHIRGPIIIVIDAVDECGNPTSRAPFLSILSEEFPQLPDVFRFLVTTRPEADIVDHLRSYLPNKFPTKILDPAADSSIADVQLFIRHELTRIGWERKLGPAWPKESHLRTLVNLAGGLFIWASAAVRLIDDFKPNEKLKTLIAQKSTRVDLDSLYSTALESAVYWPEREVARDARAVLACVMLAREPLSDVIIDRLLASPDLRLPALTPTSQDAKSSALAARVLPNLRSVIQWSPGATARAVHPALVEYLTTPSRSGGTPWAIDVRVDQRPLALECLRILNSELRFNICGLEDSHVPNTEVVELSVRVAKKISPQLSYASRFWYNHLQEAAVELLIVQAIDKFFREKFLYWLEVLSLLGQVSIVSAALAAAATYVKEDHGDLKDLITDARRFVSAFEPAMIDSAAHIYLSALPFVPQESRIAQVFNPCFPRTLRITGSGNEWPTDTQELLPGHTDWVRSVRFSPDGTRIISGADDKTVCVWDAESGALLAGPCSSHKRYVNSVAYSPDGARIVSGSDDGNICVWDALTGEIVGWPFEGQNGYITSVSFSPDGKRIASGSTDSTIFMWDAETGKRLEIPFEGNIKGVTSISFSPDGTHIVSGSVDGSLRIFDAQTGATFGEPFEDHTTEVTSVDYSPDGTRIVSAWTDNTICIFDAETGQVVGEPFERHSTSSVVYSVNFSPNGMWIACGSSNQGVFVLDAQTGALVSEPLDGHTSSVFSVNFSPDGTRIASASADGTWVND
ncbi:hypothetical protein C8R43DRAFT_975442 [Mycena crocata]|nr:hypothetical protein C8R43DRAFT_975442 [Mycena crocata]